MFLLVYSISIMKHLMTADTDSSLLKSRDKTTAGLGSTGGGSWGSRTDGGTVGCGGTSKGTAVGKAVCLVSGVARRGELVVSAREGQGTRSNKALSLVGVGWVSLNAVHLCERSLEISGRKP